MLSLDYNDDFVLGTGESDMVREFAQAALKEIKMELTLWVVVLKKFICLTMRTWLRSLRNFIGL